MEPLLACLAAVFLCSVPQAARADDSDVTYVAVKAATVITVSGESFSPGTVVIEDGKISLVGGAKIEYPPSAKVINARGETIMPGFIHPRSRYGLMGYDRKGVHGDQTAASEVYPSQMDFEDLIKAGYTAICYVPDGEGVPGLAAAFRTAGPEEARKLSESVYLQVVPAWNAKGKETLRGALKKAKEEIEKVEKARKEWEEKQKAKKEQEKKEEERKEEEKPEDENGNDNGNGKNHASRQGKHRSGNGNGEEGEEDKKPEKPDEKGKPEEDVFKPPPIDPKYQPLVDLIQQKEGVRMMIKLTRASDLHHLDDVLEPYDDLAHSLYLATARSGDYHHVVEPLGERKARVLLRPWIHFLPQTTFRYNLAAELAEAGCEVSFVPWEDSRREFLGARARLSELVRAGLPRAVALKALTLHPARAIGADDRLGSLEKGRDADLVFLDGDPLDPHTSVTRVMILGEIVWKADDP